MSAHLQHPQLRAWAIDPVAYAQLEARAARSVEHLNQTEASAKIHAANGGRLQYPDDFISQRQPYQVTKDGIAMIHVNQVLSQGLLGIDKFYGDTDYLDLADEYAEARSDSKVRGVFQTISSPGGAVCGLPECTDALAELASTKPVMSYTSTMAASAAYYLSCGGNYFYASRSATAGSIGTICMRMDVSAALEKMGVKVNVITSSGSDLKATFSPYAPLTEEQEKYLQQFLDSANDGFKSQVRASRGDAITDDTMRGQLFDAPEAKKRGLLDETASFAKAYSDLLLIAR